MIKEAYCSYEVSKLLKEKGFDGEIHTTYDDEGYTQPSITHQMAMAWLREKKYISIVIDDEIPLTYKYIVKKYFINDKYRLGTGIKLDSTEFIKYENAVEAALKYCLENLI